MAIKNFGERNIRAGEPITLLQERFVPVYFMHRFALNGTSKAIGGMEYSNAVRGDAQQATRPVAYQQQMDALRAHARRAPPRRARDPRHRAHADGAGRHSGHARGRAFSAAARARRSTSSSAAQTLAQMIVDMVLQRDRAARLVEFATRGSGPHLTLAGAIDALVGATWGAPTPSSAKHAALQRVAQRTVADKLLMLAADTEAAPQVRAMAELKIADLRTRARARQAGATTDDERAHWLSIVDDFTRWIDKRELPKFSPSLVRHRVIRSGWSRPRRTSDATRRRDYQDVRLSIQELGITT